jgi:tetratricopeptide (TPR) repeat protein
MKNMGRVMQETDQSNERLHQLASAQYLQGKFEEALTTWTEILKKNSVDERAKEGVRLCELLTEDSAAAAAAAANESVSTDAAPRDLLAGEAEGANVAAPDESIEFELPNLELDLPETEKPDPSRQSDGIDLGVVPETLQVDGEIPEAPAPEPSVETVDPETSDAEAGPIVEGLFGDDTEPLVEKTGAVELGKRAQDLLNEARAAFDAGDIETARSVLERVFILDEGHAEARELQEQIENGVPPISETADVADLDAPDHDAVPGGFDLAAEAPEAPEATPELAPELAPDLAVADPPASEVLDDPAADDFPDFDVDAEFEESEVDEFDAVEPSTGKINLPQLTAGSSKTRWIVIGVVAGVFVVVAVGFWMKMRAIEPRETPPPIVQPAENAAEPVAEPQVPVEPEPVPQVNAAPTEDLDTLLERANNAFVAGEYSAAIVAFDAVLKIEPRNFEAKARMQEATEAYRAEQELRQQWVAATSLFRDGEYRSALQMIYRLPEDSEENRIRLDRYKENGWYNLGLLALRSGQCERALGHFQEAAEVDADDADVNMALALCETCKGGTQRSGFKSALAAMKIRGLDD